MSIESIFTLKYTIKTNSQKYYFQKPIEDPLETDMFDLRPTCLIRDRHTVSETDMSDRRPTWLIGDPLDMLDQGCQFSRGLRSGMWSPMGLRSDMLVSNGSPKTKINYNLHSFHSTLNVQSSICTRNSMKTLHFILYTFT